MKLNELQFNEGSRKAKKRVGRGMASGTGKTSGRGHKGQKSRSGVAIKGFEGGQMPIHRRLPKRGFNNFNRKDVSIVRLDRLIQAIEEKKLDAKSVISKEALIKAGLLDRKAGLYKLLSNNVEKLDQKIEIEVNNASKSAKDLVEKAGGKLVLVETKTAEPQKKESSAKAKKESK